MQVGVTPKQFYSIGVVCMTIITLFNAINFYLSFDNMNLYSKVSQFFNIIFNLSIALFFLHLTINSTVNIDEENDSTIEEIKQALKDKK